MLQKNSIWRTAGAFFNQPLKEQYLLEISRNINLAHTSVKMNLEELKMMGIIKESIIKKGKRSFPVFKADLNSKTYIRYKKLYNITMLVESGLIEYLEAKLMPKSIVLFGSYQKGEDLEDSDIDLFVECEADKIDLNKYERMLLRKVQLHFKSSFTSYPKELKNSIINGIVLMGFLEGYK